MIIGIPKETFPNESRVALLPSEIKQLTSNNLSFQIESGAGNGAFFTDESYENSGASVMPDIYEKSEVILRIHPPSKNEILIHLSRKVAILPIVNYSIE